jgi:mRNA interferase RelE/StbE
VAKYSLRIKRSAAKEIEAVARKVDRQRIVQRIQALGVDPQPPGCEKLAGPNDRFRIRQGPYRIVYRVDDDSRVIEIFRVGHRREVYR